jgi:short-subunit dehydrogenase
MINIQEKQLYYWFKSWSWTTNCFRFGNKKSYNLILLSRTNKRKLQKNTYWHPSNVNISMVLWRLQMMNKSTTLSSKKDLNVPVNILYNNVGIMFEYRQ